MLIDKHEAERRSGISARQWASWAEQGKIPSTQPGGPGTMRYIDSAVVDRAVAQAKPDPMVVPVRYLADGTPVGGGRLQPEYGDLGGESTYDHDDENGDPVDRDGFPAEFVRRPPEVRLTTRKQEREKRARQRALEDGNRIPTIDQIEGL